MPCAAIIASASGDNTIIAASALRRFRIKRMVLVAKAAVDIQFKSGTDLISGVMGMAALGQLVISEGFQGQEHWLVGSAINKAFIINLSGAIVVGGFLVYEMLEG